MNRSSERLNKFSRYIDANKSTYVDNLRKVTEIRSVPSDETLDEEVIQMLQWVEKFLQEAGAVTDICNLNMELGDRAHIWQPSSVLLATVGNDPKMQTVCVYCQAGVEPAQLEDGWVTSPFNMQVINGVMFGRGIATSKGPLLCWLHVIDAYKKTKQKLPVNVKFVIEAMPKTESPLLRNFIFSKKFTFFSDVDYVCLSGGNWLSPTKPCIIHGQRGYCYFKLTVQGGNTKLCSGLFGGLIREPMTDLMFLLNSLHDMKGDIKIPGVQDVSNISPEDEHIFRNITFSVSDLCSENGLPKLVFKEKTAILAHRWRVPSLSIHSIEGDTCSVREADIIPCCVVGKFSVRIVHHQTPERIHKSVGSFLDKLFTTLKSSNEMSIEMTMSASPWYDSPSNLQYLAAQKAVKHVYKTDPDLIREGDALPMAMPLQQVTGKSVLLLPISPNNTNGAHSINERLDVKSFMNGHKLFGAYLYELGQLKKKGIQL